MKRALGACLSAVVALSTLPARASEPATPRVELRYDTSADLFIIATGIYVSVVAQLALNPELVPKRCRWCAPPGFDARARNALVWEDNTKSAEFASNVTTFVLVPAVAFGATGWAAAFDGRSDEAGVNSLIIAEATTTTIALTQAVKPIAGRARPAVYYDAHDWQSYPRQEINGSFFSGHSSTTFALAVSSGTVASMRGYRLAPLVWGVGLPLAAFTAYLRLAADAHYLSDVVVGSVVGAGIGFAMPYFMHSPRSRSSAWSPTLLPMESGAGLGVSGFF